MSLSGMFWVRFGYLRWRHHLRTGEAPGFAEIGRYVKRTGAGVSGWQAMEEAPTDYRLHPLLVEFFGLLDDRWLIRNEGQPPDPELWEIWVGYRKADLKAFPKPAQTHITRATAAAAKKGAKRSSRAS